MFTLLCTLIYNCILYMCLLHFYMAIRPLWPRSCLLNLKLESWTIWGAQRHSHDTVTSTLGGNITTGRTRHPLSNTRRPSVPRRCCTRLERSSTLSVICIDNSYFSTTFKDIPVSIPSQLLFVVSFLVLLF